MFGLIFLFVSAVIVSAVFISEVVVTLTTKVVHKNYIIVLFVVMCMMWSLFIVCCNWWALSGLTKAMYGY